MENTGFALRLYKLALISSNLFFIMVFYNLFSVMQFYFLENNKNQLPIIFILILSHKKCLFSKMPV